MKEIMTVELTAGMVTAAPVYSDNGQLVVGADVMLTPQLINHMKFYGVLKASICSDSIITVTTKEHNSKNASEDGRIISYQERIRSTSEFRHFKKMFLNNIAFLKAHIHDVLLMEDEEKNQLLLNQMLDLFKSMDEEAHILEMLNCIRSIDTSTYAHCLNVAILSRLMGRWLHYSPEEIDTLTLCGLFHDIGKSKIPKQVLMKPDQLNEDEYSIMKKHSLYGYEILKPLPIDPRIKRVALMHHERSDGTGYPLGLSETDIDPLSVIVSIADVYDAMTTDRVYRDAICPFEVIETFEKEGFTKYNEDYVTIFLNHIVDTYMNYYVLLNNGSYGQVVLKNKKHLSRPTIYLSSREFLDLTLHPELYIKDIV